MKAIIDSETDGIEVTKKHFTDSLRFPLFLVGLLWIIHLYLAFEATDPGMYGIMSRRVWGIRGIFTGPLVHGSWRHLLSNTFPLFVLTFISLYFYKKVAMRAFWMIYFITGTAVWLFARPESHIGISGVVYGLVAFIFWNGIFRRSFRSIILAGIVMLLYSGMFMGILPEQRGISWESHLFGSLIGIFTSFWFKGELEDDELSERRTSGRGEGEDEKNWFLPRDIFEKTKMQRREEALEAERLLEEERRRQQMFPPFWNQDSTW